jgi:hypothetical protein
MKKLIDYNIKKIIRCAYYKWKIGVYNMNNFLIVAFHMQRDKKFPIILLPQVYSRLQDDQL